MGLVAVDMEKIKVIYIGPMIRSGTTLLDLMLNNHSKTMSVGEVFSIDEWIEKDLLCSCSKKISECNFWNRIYECLPSGKAFRLCGVVSFKKYLLLSKEKKRAYAEKTYTLFKHVKETSGKEYIIDSSKSFNRLRILLESGMFQIYVIHLVRNGKGVIKSMQRRDVRPSFEKATYTNPENNTFKSSLVWSLKNRVFGNIGQSIKQDYILCRLEDITDNTESEMRKICRFLGISFELGVLRPITGDIHNISGSSWRYQEDVKVRPSTADWSTALSRKDNLLFEMVAGRMNRKYGY